MAKNWTWTKLQTEKLEWVQGILLELKDYLPVTLRQIHYQLVAKGLIENTKSQYTMLSQLLKYGRIDGFISWEAIEDRMRQAFLNQGWMDKNEFLRDERNKFLTGYRRHLQQGQENYVEVWLEKYALAGIFARVVNPLCIPLCPTRGFSSVSFLRRLRNRVLTSQRNGQRYMMLYFGDFDPSGDVMLPAMERTLEVDFKLENMGYQHVALKEKQIEQYDLPVKMGAAKVTDPRYRKFVEKYGPQAVELDALSPKVLRKMIDEAIGRYVDLSKVDRHLREEEKEKPILEDFRDKVQRFIDENWESTP